MQTLRILGFLLLLLIGAIALKHFISPASVSPVKKETTSPLDKNKVKIESKSPRIESEQRITQQPTNPPPSPTATPVPTNPPASNLSPYRYPNAGVSSESSNELRLTSNDSAQTVTDWYKNAISSQGLHTTSFVQTSSNDNILNKLAAGLPEGGQVTITISQPNPGSSVSIDVVISHS